MDVSGALWLTAYETMKEMNMDDTHSLRCTEDIDHVLREHMPDITLFH